MPSSSNDSHDNEVSTPYSERDLEKEVKIVLHNIKHLPWKWRPSSTQLVIGIVHRENLKLFSGALRQYYSGVLSPWRAKALTSSFGGLQQTIRKSKSSGDYKSLVLLVTPFASEIEFHVSSRFESLTIVRCANNKYTGSFLAIYPVSTYCDVCIPDWDLRQNFLRHSLHLGSGICLEDRFESRFLRSSTLTDSDVSVIRSQAETLQDKSISRSQRKAIVASILGVLVGGSTAARIYSCVKITSTGIFLTCKGFKWSLHSIKIAEFAFGASYSSASSFAALATTAGPPILLGAAAGASVGALVYYLPWNNLFQWLRNAVGGIWNWLIEMFQALRDAVASCFKEPKSKIRRGSHGSRHHSSRVNVP